MEHRDTIVALSTAMGRAGIAIIRVSGRETRFVLETISGKIGRPRVARLARLRSKPDGDAIDDAVVLFFPSPSSFTGEDIAEFHVHGSQAVIAATLNAIISLSPDLRLAEAGEYARRAFENGKMDLVAIEGLADLIDSETEWQRRQALRMLQGDLSKKTEAWREALITSLAYLDAEIDFTDEGDVGEGWTGIAMTGISAVFTDISRILTDSHSGERLRAGLEVVILGAPNSGKSSLLNAISKRDVAIVTDIAGTTRDLIEVRCDLDGLPVTFIDTAGLRESPDPIEKEGIRRAMDRAASADLIVQLNAFDSDQEQFQDFPAETINVTTKSDLQDRSRGRVSLANFSISTLTGDGVQALLSDITKRLKLQIGEETPLISRTRQRTALKSAEESLYKIIRLYRDQSAGALSSELVAEDLRHSIRQLERLIGKVDVDDVLDRIFGRFCIGK